MGFPVEVEQSQQQSPPYESDKFVDHDVPNFYGSYSVPKEDVKLGNTGLGLIEEENSS